jgi:SOS-response transcriptional repressor LexA
MTPRQREVLKFIIIWSERFTYPPTAADIGEYLGTTPENARQLINRLVKQGYLTKTPHMARSIEVTSLVEKAYLEGTL